ncbi:MAG: sigma-54 dependent transcriptional regulator [Xanthomonadales bacterium]|nr:sigma-54 dependent transcriptional regulator [Xanthomonadales bacterium]
MASGSILVVDDEPDIRELVREILQDEGYEVSIAEDADSAREARRGGNPDLALLDIWMPRTDGITLLREWAKGGALPFPVIMMSGHGTVETAVEATKLGAYDFIEKPVSLPKLLLTVERALEASKLKRENEGLRQQLSPVLEPIGSSETMRELREQIQRLARHDTSVLITGEAGVGKSATARFLHSISSRSAGPFVELNFNSIAPDDFAREIFGCQTGDQVVAGRLEQATGGTIYLDEVAKLDADTQSRLASALENQLVTRQGGGDPLEIDVRVVASTQQDLEAEVRRGGFSEELFYQINVVPLRLPPLRERPEDVPDLLRFYTDYFPAQESMPYRHFSVAAQNRLRNHSWPGNLWELKNLVQRLLIRGGADEIELGEVEQALGAPVPRAQDGVALAGVDFELPLREAREQFERAYLVRRLKEVQGSVGRLAKAAGMERTHLYRKLRALDIDPKRVAEQD